jgi:glycosyltransferase involved in cell wall biosynthesis
VTQNSPGRPVPLRVLRASPRVPPLIGGGEIHVSELSRSLAVMGVEQTLLFAEGAPDIPGVETARLPVPATPSNIVRDALFGARVATYPVGGFQVVHTHGDAPVARGGAIAARRLGAAHVHTFHGDLVPRGLRALVLRTLLPKRSWYLTVSRRVAASLVRAGANPDRVFIRTSGVRAEFFRPRTAGRRPDVVVGGRLIPEKRILDSARSWAAADTGDSRLLVFGVGPDATALRGIAEQAENVVWLGELDADALSEVLTEAAVGVVMGRLPTATSSNEGTPTLALEMLAAGCFPVVGPDTGEAPRIIRDSRFGEVSDDLPAPAELANLAASWSSEEMDSERERVRTLTGSGFSWGAVAAEIKAFYERLLAMSAKHSD